MEGKLLPRQAPELKWLEYYAQQLGTVEINYTFYRMPSEKTIAGWNASDAGGIHLRSEGAAAHHALRAPAKHRRTAPPLP